jgi:hypothetical protein
MKDGMGRQIKDTREAIEKALRGDTNYAASDDDYIVITYDEENEEIDISVGDMHYDTFYLEDDKNAMNIAIYVFLDLMTF